MEFLRRAANPWGQDVFLGISWDLMWAAAVLGLAFVLAHAGWSKVRSGGGGEVTAPPDAAAGQGLARRILRHSLSARLFHWIMAASMIVLLVTAFFPAIGVRFDWVTIHWVAGLVLLATILFHVFHSTMARNWRTIWIDRNDLKEGRAELSHFLTGKGEAPEKAGKYPTANKAFHHTAAIVGIGAIVTGLVMMVRVDTPFWAKNPYLLGDQMWGVIYVLHGLCGVALITLTAAHVYFAIRPDKWWLTRSMIKGWITREEYLAHHDPAKWTPESAPEGESVLTGTATDPAAVA